MKAKLRGHHLICLNFFRGEGYSEEFIRNIYSVIAKDSIEIVKGPDDVCAKCPYLKGYICKSAEFTDEMIQDQDNEALKLLEFMPGMKVDWKMIADKLPGIIEVWKAQFCGGCGYRKVCFVRITDTLKTLAVNKAHNAHPDNHRRHYKGRSPDT